MRYLDFDITIGRGTERSYPVAVRSTAGEIDFTMRFPFDEPTLEKLLLELRIAVLESGKIHRKLPTEEEQAAQKFGRQLFEALLPGEARGLFSVSRSKAAQEQLLGVRLRLHIQAPDLAALPWEYLYDASIGEYLCLLKSSPIVRYPELPLAITPLTVAPPLRILGMIASPSDQDPLDVTSEQARMEEALKTLKNTGLVELSWLEGQTWEDLQEAMWRGPWHIFHFIGHGAFDKRSEEGLIALADEQGKTHLLGASDLALLLTNHGSIRLALLNACEGATGSRRDIFSSTAATLARRGIPAVLAMQEDISDQAAVRLTRTFYRALTAGMPVDAALAEARAAIRIGLRQSLEWGTPVLYLRAPDGVLFTLSSAPLSPPEGKSEGQPARLAEVKPATDRPAIKSAQQEQADTKPAPGTTLGTYEYLDAGANTIAWSPDGNLLASGGSDATVRIWDAITGKTLRVLRGHSDTVYAVVWSPDGRLLASGSWDKTVRVWEAASGELLQRYEGHSEWIWAIAWSPDGRLLASGGRDNDKTVQVWEAASGQLLQRYEGHSSDIWSVAWSPDGLLLASAGGKDDKTVQVWKATSGKLLQRYEGHSETVRTVAWSPDGRLLASGGDDKTVQVWEATSGERLRSNDHSYPVATVAWSPDGRLLASGNSNAVLVWEATSGRPLHSYIGHAKLEHAISWSPNGGHLLALGGNNPLQVWEVLSGKLLQRYQGPTDYVYSHDWSPDRNLLALGGGDKDKTVQVWEATSGKLLQRYEGHSKAVWAVAWSPDGCLLASGSSDETVQVWEAASGRQLLSYEHSPDNRFYSASSLAWSPDGRLLALGGFKVVQVLEASSGKQLQSYKGHSGDVNVVVWSPDGELIASGSDDGTVQVREVTSGRLVRGYPSHSNKVSAVAWSPDGRLVASGGEDRTVQVWEATTGITLLVYRGHCTNVNSVAWSPDRERIASSDDYEVHIWQAP